MKKWSNIIFVLVLMTVFAPNVYGYIDPSATTYILQVVLGAVIAGGAAIGVYWHKIKLFFKNRKNKNKK